MASTGDSRLTPVQIKAFAAAFLGWAFDGLDGYLYVIVAQRFVGQLLGKAPTDPDTITNATIIQAVFLVGWAVGGAVFGRVGDSLGRSRTLTLTVLTYALFTGASFFATEWWHLLIFRFLAALGIGGEWAAGSALVAETLHGKHKVWASALLQSGYMVGCILASLTAGLMKDLDPKWVFVVGVLPALLTVFIRAAVPEPESWRHAKATQQMPKVSSLFVGEVGRRTLIAMAFVSIALIVSWGFLFFMNFAIRQMPEARGLSPAELASLTSRVAIVYFSVNIAANFFATYLAQAAGYRRAFAIMMGAGMLVMLVGFSGPLTLSWELATLHHNVYLVASLTAFFSLGFFGMFPMYIPPLFPTLVRTLASGLTYNVGRLASAGGVLFAGEVTKSIGPGAALQYVSLLFVPGIVLAMVLPEPREEG